MNEFSDALSVTVKGLQAQATRLRVLTENISNADTPGYRRKTIPFEMVHDDLGRQVVEVGRTNLDQSELERIHDPAHPLSNEDGYYDGSNVNLIVEIADAREAQRSYEANLKMFEQTRNMSSSLMELLRR